nr:PEP-CTERM sorting domain-containing protein [Herbaspirillum sp. ASV7]
MKKFLLAALFALANLGPGTANATTLSTTINADNLFQVYVSTNNNTLGTLVGSANDWTTTYQFNTLLTAGVTNFLHIIVANQGGPGGLLGAFVLSDANLVFANGSNTLLTGDAGLTQNLTGFGKATSATVSEGANGAAPWGLRSGYGALTPQWVWNYASNNSGDFNTVYFSAAINVPNAVPEPGSIALLGLGLVALLAWRQRKDSRAF